MQTVIVVDYQYMFATPFDWDFAFRIMLAALLGAILGIERDLHAKPAGLRTNMLICMGSCLFGILSSEGYADESGTQDPTRIASLMVQGIGFLGAGVLIKGDEYVTGLTTAAVIWVVAAIGLAIGAGMEEIAVFVAVFAVILTVLLEPLSDHLEKVGRKRKSN